jgi:hypothetical protein
VSKRIVAVGAAVLLSAGCGGEDPAPTWQAPPSPAAPTSAAPARLAKITSACDLLPAAKVIDLLGGNGQTKLSGRELPREKRENGNVWRHCGYGRGGNEPFRLSVATMPDRADTVDETIDAVAEAAGNGSKRIEGLGSAAVGYTEGEGRSVMAVAPYQKELRVVQFTGPALVPQDKLAEVVRQVIGKI